MKNILKFSFLLIVTMTSMSSYAIDGDFLLNVKKGKGNEISFSMNEIKKVNATRLNILIFLFLVLVQQNFQ